MIRDIRGKRSQAELSKELNSSFNLVNRWETGTRDFYWKDFLQLSEVQGVSVKNLLNEMTGLIFAEEPSDQEVFNLLTDGVASERLNSCLSKGQVHRLKNGTSKLKFSDFLEILEMAYGRSERFIRFIFGDQLSDGMALYFSSSKDYAQLAASDITYTLLRLSLSLKPYLDLPEHSSQILADLLGLSNQEIEQRLETLLALGVIEKSGTHYSPAHNFVDIRAGGREASAKTMSLWRKKIAEHGELPVEEQKRLKTAFFVYRTNREIEKQIFELTNKFYVELTGLIRQYEEANAETLQFMSIEFFSPLLNSEVL